MLWSQIVRPMKSRESKQTAGASSLEKFRLDARLARKQSSFHCQNRNGDIHDVSRWLHKTTLNAESLTVDDTSFLKTIVRGEKPLLPPDFHYCHCSGTSRHPGILLSQSPQQVQKPLYFR